MKLRKLSEEHNPLIGRKEVVFEVDHASEGTPSRAEVLAKLLAEYGESPEVIVLRRLQTKTGTSITSGYAEIYDSAERASMFTPKHVRESRLSKEEA